mgnify:CR=1 FL=1
MDECVRKITLDEAIENARKVVNNCHQPLMTFETMNSIVKDNCREEHEQLAQWLEELKKYKELEEKLCVMFAGDCSLSDVVENLERQITETDKDHPVNARILTYEDAEKWNEYRELEKQGRLLKVQCNVGTEVFAIFPIGDHYEKCQIKKIEIHSTMIGKIRYFVEPTAHMGCSFSYFDDEFENHVFLTKEEAEAKLKEMETSNIRDE